MSFSSFSTSDVYALILGRGQSLEPFNKIGFVVDVVVLKLSNLFERLRLIGEKRWCRINVCIVKIKCASYDIDVCVESQLQGDTSYTTHIVTVFPLNA
jgi:hypothetical protein